ncbi:MAG: helix-turn-helix transcriptional regulator, partial [Clostridia bacterium]|nr:helix-turn-helix transcriptional regulator [Clostridia bacterium]
MTDRSIIGQKIAYLRKLKGLTQSELAEQLGVSPQAVSQWERSETLPDILTLPQIAEIFNENIAALLGVEELNAEKVPAESGTVPEEEAETGPEETDEEYYDRLAAKVEAEEAEYDRWASEAESDEHAHTITIPEVHIPDIHVPEITIPEMHLPNGEVIPKKHMPAQHIPGKT